MADTNYHSDRCILSGELSSTEGYDSFPGMSQARCAGAPPSDKLKLYSLCLDCDLLHQHGDRSIFSRISSCLAQCHENIIVKQPSIDLGFTAIQNMLERLSIGDPNARVILPYDIKAFAVLEPLLNQMADFIKDMVEDSHETAMGLCEHYETLLHLADGDLDARASVNSPIELIAKLGELINSQTQSFLNVIKLQHALEQEMRSMNQRLQGIIDFLPDATFVIDTDHRVIAWNKAIEEMTGVAKEDILGAGNYAYSMPFYGVRRPVLIDLIGTEEEVLLFNYKYFKRRGQTIAAEVHLPAINNFGERQLWITASPLYDHDGNQIGSIESIRDISDFKKAELEKEQLKEQLHHTQKLDSIGQLAGGVAHEFNNVLAGILGYAGILEMRLGPDSPHLATVQRIINASQKAASLTHGLLTFSRKQIMTTEPVHLNNLIFDMKEMLCRLAGENIRVEFQLVDKDLVLMGDFGQLQQIVLNLYNNARDAMPDGGCLTIASTRVHYDGNEPDPPVGISVGSYVLLSVSDTGHGIKSDDLERIFDPFFTTKEIGKGTGLGLSMVFGIVQQHNGHIKVTSRPGQGTTFSIWFPEITVIRSETVEEQTINTSCQIQDSGTILIGEDNDDVRPMIVELLQGIGYHVLEACDGEEVVAVMENLGDTVDLLLLDVIMPRMNGQEALKAVRKFYPQIPCIFLSGYSDDILHQKGTLTDDCECLAKPIMPDRLIKSVRETLGERKLK